MSEWRYFQCKVGSANKYWKFRFINGGCSVEKRWGRVGGSEAAQTKDFPNTYRAQGYADKESAGKLRKGYVEIDSDSLDEEVDIAQTIGTRWKIAKMEFVGEPWGTLSGEGVLSKSNEYIPSCGVYVEMLESWSKERAYLLINSSQALQFRAGASNGNINVGGSVMPDSYFVAGVRKMLHRLAEAVEETVVKFAAVGVRYLSLDDGDGPMNTEIAKAFELVAAKTGVSAQVISKFAAIGSRALEL